jgi:hypothetical protein
MSSQTINVLEEDIVVIGCDEVKDYNPEHILPESAEEINIIRAWLKATNYAHESGEYQKHLASHTPGTGAWLTSSATYSLWLNSPTQGLLWIKGIPGSGKSVIAAHLIDILTKSHPGVPVLYFFFRQIIDANHEPAALLRDWLDQVLIYSPPLQKKLKQLVKDQRSLDSVSMDDLCGYLRLAFHNLPDKVFCVADALDEMDRGNGQFLRALSALGQWLPCKVKIIMTSRPVATIEEDLRKADLLRLRLDENMVDRDISSYVERNLQASNISSSGQDLVREAVPGHANGIFLYAKLAMDAFLAPDAEVDAVLRCLPADLHAMYTKLLREHAIRSGVSPDIQLLILQWVTHATRPLRLLELAEIVRITTSQTKGGYASLDIKTAKEIVRAAAGPLLEILPNETVCVIHHSFTEYLKCMTRSESDDGYPVLRHGSTHGRLALACLEYLKAGCLDTIVVRNLDEKNNDYNASKILDCFQCPRCIGRTSKIPQEVQQMRLEYPFSAYATAYWHLHVIRSGDAGFPQNHINFALAAFFSEEHRTKAWLKLRWENTEKGSKGVTPLHIAARFGLSIFAKFLVADQVDVNAVD